MKHAILCLSCLLFFSSFVQAQSKPVSDDAKQVFATISRWADAVRDRDRKTLESLFADDMIVTLSDGSVRGKAEELEALKPDPKVTFSSVSNDDIGVKMFTDVAVVTALTKMQYVSSGKESSFGMRYTAVFARKDGRWQIVALQTARPVPGS